MKPKPTFAEARQAFADFDRLIEPCQLFVSGEYDDVIPDETYNVMWLILNRISYRTERHLWRRAAMPRLTVAQMNLALKFIQSHF